MKAHAATVAFALTTAAVIAQDRIPIWNPLDNVERPAVTIEYEPAVVPLERTRATDIFNITFTGLGVLTTQQRNAFLDARDTWESLLLGYIPNTTLTGVEIEVVIEPIDGPFNVLGSAGPRFIRSAGGFVLARTGRMRFDEDDVVRLIGNGTFDEVILHEMGHVLGIGTLWDNNNIYINGTGENTGVNAVQEFNAEFVLSSTGQSPNLNFAPVELDFGSGTRDGHWDETTIYTDANGQGFLANELMTGRINTVPSGAPIYISDLTLASFADMGFVTVPFVDIPADFDGNGVVNISDLFAFITAFTASPPDPNTDFDGNGVINVSDLFAFITAFTAAP
ncbi:MAG: GC-type dockerin domain-anchored protein [Planctomycetota bacterium]